MAYTSFIDTSYFIGEINFPNIAANTVSLTQAIGQYEKEILIELLGYKLYSLLIADQNKAVEDQEQKYIDLVNGAEFTHVFNGVEMLLKWEGLKNTQKQSLIAYYVYYKLLERNTLHLSDVGTVALDSKAGKRVSPMDNMINAWDRMRTLYGITPVEFKRCYSNSISNVFNDDASAYNFLFANKLDYPDWSFKSQWGINSFGI